MTNSQEAATTTSTSIHAHHGEAQPALVLVNLGTPTAPESGPVRAFLREFLSDRRVIEMSPLLWKPILEGIILRVRPREVAAKYRSIWMEEGSPLMHYTREQARRLGERLPGVRVEVAMRYGQPSIGSVLDRLHAEGVRRVAVLPAYPQYAASTVTTINDAVAQWIGRNRDGFERRLHRSFPAAPAYIGALATALERHWERVGRPNFLTGDRVVVSFHSIPVAMDEAGDPYRAECRRTVAALESRLGLAMGSLTATFQSVFGRAEWLGPQTIEEMTELGAAKCPRVDVICPGFMADCLETLEEIDQLNRETFTTAGGGSFYYIPWGNDSEGAIATLAEQARNVLTGWICARRPLAPPSVRCPVSARETTGPHRGNHCTGRYGDGNSPDSGRKSTCILSGGPSCPSRACSPASPSCR